MKYGSADITITLDDATGTPRIVTDAVLAIGGLKIVNMTQKSTPFSANWEENLVTGIRSGAAIALSGLLDDTADTGYFDAMTVQDADAVPGFTRTLTVGLGGSPLHQYSAEVILQDSAVNPKAEALTEYAATLLPTGQISLS